MQILIDIDENVFTRLFDNGIEDYEMANDDLSAMAIRRGAPLPKGHGRLIDADKLKEWVQDVIKVNYTIEDRTDAVEQELLVLDWFDERIDSAPTIIEAEVGE